MVLWNLVFHPKTGERNSPVDRLSADDCSQTERANIMQKLSHLQQLQPVNWPYKWSKPIEEFKELIQGDFRVFYQLIGRTIVVCHVCRKVGKKAKRSDIDIARANSDDYKSGGTR